MPQSNSRENKYDFQKYEASFEEAKIVEERYQRENSKKLEVVLTARSYEEFCDLVKASGLKSVSKKDFQRKPSYYKETELDDDKIELDDDKI